MMRDRASGEDRMTYIRKTNTNLGGILYNVYDK